MRLQFGLSSFERAKGDLPRLPVINMFAEEASTVEGGVVLQSRPGLSDRAADMGTGPVEALFKRDGVIFGRLFGVSNGELYQETTSLGAVTGSQSVSMAGNETGLMVTAGGTMRFYDGTTLANVTFPDSANVIKVLSGASRFIAIRGGSGKFYWTEALGSTFGALDFATAESMADGLLDALFIDDGLILFGTETVEFWPNTGDDNLPFVPLEGRVFEKGIKATGCAAIFDASFCWVGNDNVLYTNGPKPIAISDPGLEEKIAATTDCRLWTFFIEGTEFLALRVDEGTWVRSSRSGKWSEMRSVGQDNWIPQCYAAGIFGSSIDGRTMEFNAVHTDLGGELERTFRAGVPLDGGIQPLSNVTLRVNSGQTPYLTGDYTNPTVEMRLSRDVGQTWGDWKAKTLGAQGKYRKKVQWRGVGTFSRPGFLAEFRCTDPVPFALSGVYLNEPFGGRS